MAADSPLSELAPLRLPEPVGWWPVAPAVWVILLLLVLLTTALLMMAWRRYRKRAYRREADVALCELFEQWQTSGSASLYLAEANRVLKAVALHSAPAEEVAALSGEAWRSWLQARAPTLRDPDPRWVDSWYGINGVPEDLNLNAVHLYFRDWVQKHA